MSITIFDDFLAVIDARLSVAPNRVIVGRAARRAEWWQRDGRDPGWVIELCAGRSGATELCAMRPGSCGLIRIWQLVMPPDLMMEMAVAWRQILSFPMPERPCSDVADALDDALAWLALDDAAAEVRA